MRWTKEEYLTQRTVRLSEWSQLQSKVRLCNTDPPKYETPPIMLLGDAEPEQIDWTEQARWERGSGGWQPGDIEGRQLSAGVDWLTVYAWGGELRADVAELLREARASAEAGTKMLARIGGEEYAVQSRGRKPIFRYLLVGPSATIAVRAPARARQWTSSDMTVCVELRAPTLWRRGAKSALKAWRKAVGSLFARPPTRWTVGRIDLAVDVRCEALPADAHLMARAARQTFSEGVEAKPWTASTYGAGGSSTGWRWGTGDVVVRVYRKDRELKVSRKFWMREVWGGWEGEAWRLEVQLRGDVLRELVTDAGPMKGADPNRWLEEATSLWAHFVGGQGAWCSARISPVPYWKWDTKASSKRDKNKSRWPVHPWWGEFSKACISRGPKHGVARKPRHLPSWAEDPWPDGGVGRVFVAVPRAGPKSRGVAGSDGESGHSPSSSRQVVTTCRPPWCVPALVEGHGEQRRLLASSVRSRACQEEALSRARLPAAVARDYSAAVGAVARVAALEGREAALQALDVLLTHKAIEKAGDRVVFGRALDAIAIRVGPLQGGQRPYQLRGTHDRYTRDPRRDAPHTAVVG